MVTINARLSRLQYLSPLRRGASRQRCRQPTNTAEILNTFAWWRSLDFGMDNGAKVLLPCSCSSRTKSSKESGPVRDHHLGRGISFCAGMKGLDEQRH